MCKTNAYDILVVGAGIFGITTALEMKKRGYHVAVLDPGPLPHPLAASTDISKMVRLNYGSDEAYMTLAELAYSGWLQWNEELGETLFHDVGITMLTSMPMAPGGMSMKVIACYVNEDSRLSASQRRQSLEDSLPANRESSSMASFTHKEATRKVVAWLRPLFGWLRKRY